MSCGDTISGSLDISFPDGLNTTHESLLISNSSNSYPSLFSATISVGDSVLCDNIKFFIVESPYIKGSPCSDAWINNFRENNYGELSCISGSSSIIISPSADASIVVQGCTDVSISGVTIDYQLNNICCISGGEILLNQGTLREGNTVEFVFDTDYNIKYYENVQFSAYHEKGLLYDTNTSTYYYSLDSDGKIYSNQNSFYLDVECFTRGRLFVVFEYDFLGEHYRQIKTFSVLPTRSFDISSDIIEGNTKTSTFTSSVTDSQISVKFSDTDEVIYGTNDGENDIFIEREFPVYGCYTATISADYTNIKHEDDLDVYWDSDPVDRLIDISGGFLAPGNVNSATKTVMESFTEDYLVKYDVDNKISLNLSLNYNHANTYAPLNIYFIDESTYTLPLSGNHSIEYVYINFGDGQKKKYNDPGFDINKVYREYGTYNGYLEYHTVHNESCGTYRQIVKNTFTVTVLPFFTKWLKTNLNSNLYKGKSFNDLILAWGKQLDRLYKDFYDLYDNVDVETITNKFMEYFFRTYGDFNELAEKIGFKSFVEGSDDPFDSFGTYNFFDRLKDGKITNTEKQEFVDYVKTTVERLQRKGTSGAIEDAIKRYKLLGWFVELWTDTFDLKQKLPIKDEVFVNNGIKRFTGLEYTTVSSPLSPDNNKFIFNSNNTPYIEINTVENSDIHYFTKDTTISQINDRDYLQIEI
jgi:hypothetical protein